MSLKQKRFYPYYYAVLAGIALAFLSAHLLFHGGVANVAPWGILALPWGFVATNARQAWKLGAVYGFALSYSFLWFDKAGNITTTQFLELLLIIPLPSLFGAVCGALLSRLAFAVRMFKHR